MLLGAYLLSCSLLPHCWLWKSTLSCWTCSATGFSYFRGVKLKYLRFLSWALCWPGCWKKEIVMFGGTKRVSDLKTHIPNCTRVVCLLRYYKDSNTCVSVKTMCVSLPKWIKSLWICCLLWNLVWTSFQSGKISSNRSWIYTASILLVVLQTILSSMFFISRTKLV